MGKTKQKKKKCGEGREEEMGRRKIRRNGEKEKKEKWGEGK